MPSDSEAYRDVLATVNQEGQRIWIYPKQPQGRFYRARTVVSLVFLALFLAAPFIKIDGEPVLLFNVLERRFVLFGLLFSPQDFYLFLLAMLTFIVFIILFTVVFGRLFCGWVCPQTVFMEMIFRRIEYWIDGDGSAQRRLAAAPWTVDKIKKRALKHFVFFVIAAVVANYFLAYIIGMDRVLAIVREPIRQNPGGFGAMILFSAAFYGVYSRLREQVCTTICPYGRLQSVLLVPDSIVVAYDFIRGEPRGKLHKQAPAPRRTACESGCSTCASCAATDKDLKKTAQNTSAFGLAEQTKKPEPVISLQGDCIDCNLCVQVCPTGIDIRNGTQLECTNCTACIDACDEVMVKINKPTGLIRYDSLTGIKTGVRKIFTPRVAAYSVALLALLSLDVGLLASRADLSITIFRSPGTMYQALSDGQYSNLYTYQIVNKTRREIPVAFKLNNEVGQIKMIGDIGPSVAAEKMSSGAFFVVMDSGRLEGLKTKLEIEAWSGDRKLKTIRTSFAGPIRD